MKDCGYRLESCVWEITLACCFECKYCGSKAGKARENELTTQECVNVAEQLKELGCRRVSLIGGEVFIRRDWDVIVKALTDRGIIVSIITNGFLFKKEHLDRLKELDVESVAVSLDGPRDIHDKYRQPGSFERAMDAIEVLTENDIPVSVISTLHSDNIARLEEMYNILSKKDIFAWQIQACSPMGNAHDGMTVDFEFSDAIDFVAGHIYEAGFRIAIADNIGYFSEDEDSIRGGGGKHFAGCAAGLSIIGIDSIGNVRGCESMYDERFIEGNLRDKRLADIWNDPEAFAYNRRFKPDMLTGKCKDCPMGRRCAAGCRSYNYFTHRKLYESLRCVRNN